MISILKKLFCRNFKRCFDENLDITKEEVDFYEKKGAIIVDVRSPQEFDEWHINGAICIPKYEIKRKVENVLKDKNKTIVLYCSTGHRSKEAQSILRKLGYKNVFNLYGGVEEYY